MYLNIKFGVFVDGFCMMFNSLITLTSFVRFCKILIFRLIFFFFIGFKILIMYFFLFFVCCFLNILLYFLCFIFCMILYLFCSFYCTFSVS